METAFPPASPSPRRFRGALDRDTAVAEALLELSPHAKRSPARGFGTPMRGVRLRGAGLSPAATSIVAPFGTGAASSPFTKFVGSLTPLGGGDTPGKWCHSLHASPFGGPPRAADPPPMPLLNTLPMPKRLRFDDSTLELDSPSSLLLAREDPSALLTVFSDDIGLNYELPSPCPLPSPLGYSNARARKPAPFQTRKKRRSPTPAVIPAPPAIMRMAQVAPAAPVFPMPPPAASPPASLAFSPNSITRIGPTNSAKRLRGSLRSAAAEAQTPRATPGSKGAPRRMLRHAVFLSPGSGTRLSPAVRVTPPSAAETSAPMAVPVPVSGASAASPLVGRRSKSGSSNYSCNCKRSRCLKLYCECFASQVVCGKACHCKECQNTTANAEMRNAAIRTTLERNPQAFKAKINREGRAHAVGCHCKKSQCLKKYCECFQAGIVCADRCKCEKCKNFPGSREMIERRARLKLPPAQTPRRAEEMPPALAADDADAMARPPQIQRVTKEGHRWLGLGDVAAALPLTYTVTAARGMPRGPHGFAAPTPPRQRRAARIVDLSLQQWRVKARSGRLAAYPIFGSILVPVTKATVFGVFAFLDNDDLYNACLVSRFWENLALDDELWEPVEDG